MGTNVTAISNNAFKGSALASITLPNTGGLTNINQSAFEDCTQLTSISLPNSITTIQSYAFKGCTGLSDAALPNLVTTISEELFAGCNNLESVTFKGNVGTFQANVFNGCTKLDKLFFDNTTGFNAGAFNPTVLNNSFAGIETTGSIYVLPTEYTGAVD